MTGVSCNHKARVQIKNLLLRAYIGIKDEEIDNLQDVIINVCLTYDAAEAIDRNEITAALNYRTITKQIIGHVDSNRFALLERLTHEVLNIVMEHGAVQWAQVEIDKPHALRYAESVSVCLEARR
ncbi:MAG: dihydroneopterin triphosphate 2'-epimerase [Marinobacter sp.]|uniref:dihydroneopterin triphosphate 2'-epimerase n=1 Tax=Marinobacter sp. TaxID=50741 RepID=UPI001B60B641|nr:dihydroneopterin triphosphate 2'-epimerase [Marinobacter sp.]MBQ0746725.1 dihydroneopterin triphosphate 2'-epimerase [Marinobacter sp.]MBQ0814393.1 dihydroneopterin triphosphate 2'-epimerase [Marinobacter sp.]|tara:strand:- start:1662 stop:2036 length:375 start_codon:yes stop_codon:yes gene_type:complete